MSHRGGGRGRSDPRRDQQPPTPSFQRGGGAGNRGRGGRSGGAGGGSQDYPPLGQSSSRGGRGTSGDYPPLGQSSSRGGRSGSGDYPPLGQSSGRGGRSTLGDYAPPGQSTRGGGPPPQQASSQQNFPSLAAAIPPPSSQSAAPASSSTAKSSQDVGEKPASGVLAPATESARPPVSSKAIRNPPRPGFGSAGRKIMVRANHFLVQVTSKDLHHYDVSINPEVTSKKINRDVISQLVTLYRFSHLGNRLPAYDGRKSLYTAGPLPFDSKEFVVKLPDKDGASASSAPPPKRDRTFKVTIKFAAKADMHHLLQFLEGKQLDAPQETIQALDVVLREVPSKSYTVVGRSFFSTLLGDKGDLGGGLEYWRGYYQSLRPTQMGLSFNIDVSARSFYEPIIVTDFIAKYFDLRDLSRGLSDQNRMKVKRALKGVKVELTHREYARSYKVAGISDKPLRELMFTLDDQTTNISVVQYFRQKYNISLKHTTLPALNAGNDKKPIYLPMEVCKIVGGQRYTKKLNERQVTALLRATCLRPNKREGEIKQMVKRNNYGRDELVAEEFGMQVNQELTVINARVLSPPMLKYHDSGREKKVDPSLGQWNMINKKMVNGGRVESWTCVNFSLRVNPDLPTEFCRQLIDMCRSKGMEFNPNPILPIRSAHPREIENALREISENSQKRQQLQLLIIILPDISGSYGKIKRVCETELGIVSQCCQPRQASKLSMQYLENVSLKINVKAGGRNTVLNDAIQRRIPLVTDKPTIIFGADVTHPQPGEDSSPSIAAVVASMDWPEVTKYRGIVAAQTHREEIIEALYTSSQDSVRGLVHGGMIRELFVAFRSATGHQPERIIFFRDGVSEGQFSQVLLHEIDAIRKACNSLKEGYLPRITFVVVQKRHHTRFFPLDHGSRDQTDKSGNILPGTVVDTQICHPTEFDFYLNSHAGIQGTSRPTHYHVLYDENGFSADGLQTLTNNLCYTYARCTRSVSIVPPAYYAHLAAFRARYYMEGDGSDAGSSSGRGSSREGTNVTVQALPAVKENVKNVMFYI